MKILVFASYKGGVGRTSACVATANILYRYGYRVAIADFDVDAPSVPSFYTEDPIFSNYDSPAGLVPWVMGDNPEFDDNIVEIAPDTPTRFRLLPAGPVCDDYLKRLVSAQWREQVELQPAAFADAVRSAFEDLPDPPDVLLVDARAGLVPISTSAVHYLADKIAFLFSGDRESAEIANRLSEEHPQKLMTVLTRFPEFADPGMRNLAPAFAVLHNPPGASLHASPGYEASAVSTIALDARSKGVRRHEGTPSAFDDELDVLTPLTLDHFRLARDLVPDLLDRAPENDPALTTIFERAEATRRTSFKLFRLAATGDMVNTSDRTRNVAIKVDTLVAILNTITGRIRPGVVGRLSPKVRRRRVTAALRDAGHLAGTNFGQALAADLDAPKDPNDRITEPAERLRSWCEFDSSTGFGYMSFEDDAVVIRRPFLHPSNLGAELLEGYVAGVMEAVIDQLPDGYEWPEGDAELRCPLTLKANS